MNKNSSGKQEQPRFLAVDFFCGAGGTTRGLLDAEGLVLAGIDKDPSCKATYTKNNHNKHGNKVPIEFLYYDIFPRSKTHPKGQRKELRHRLDEIIGLAQDRYPDTPLLFAICAPCQPFTRLSSRGKMTAERLKARDQDQNLLDHAVHFVRRYKPEFILSENVRGINQPKYGGVWPGFRKKLRKEGYRTSTKVVCSSRFGVPQYRHRTILLGVRNELALEEGITDLDGKLIVPENNPKTQVISVREAIGHFPKIEAGDIHPKVDNHAARNLEKISRLRLNSLKPGESNAKLEKTRYGDISLKCHRKAERRFKQRCFGDVYTRMHPDRPAPTITTKCNSVSNGRFGHYEQLRGISLREAAALQSFPDDYIFYPTDQSAPVAKLIGNAVPPKLAAYFSRYLVDCVKS